MVFPLTSTGSPTRNSGSLRCCITCTAPPRSRTEISQTPDDLLDPVPIPYPRLARGLRAVHALGHIGTGSAVILVHRFRHFVRPNREHDRAVLEIARALCDVGGPGSAVGHFAKLLQLRGRHFCRLGAGTRRIREERMGDTSDSRAEAASGCCSDGGARPLSRSTAPPSLLGLLRRTSEDERGQARHEMARNIFGDPDSTGARRMLANSYAERRSPQRAAPQGSTSRRSSAP